MNNSGYQNGAVKELFHLFDTQAILGPERAGSYGCSDHPADPPRQLGQIAHFARLSSLGEMTSELIHELAQPFAAIMNYSQACALLLDGGRIKEARDIAIRLGAQAKVALGMVNSLRQFSRKGSTEIQSVDLRELAQSALDLVRWEAEIRGISMTQEAPSSLPAVAGDDVLLRQVLLNLLRNAIDATGDRGTSVTVALQCMGESIEVYVRDRGPGLKPEVKAHLFEPFFTTKPGGVGIGLALSRRIIESHGGRLWADNNIDGAGACFGFTLPTARGETRALSTVSAGS